MRAKELIEILKDVDENAEISVVDMQQNNEYEIKDIRICEDRTSEEYEKFVELLILL